MHDLETPSLPKRRQVMKAALAASSIGLLAGRSGDAVAWGSYSTVQPPATTPFVEPLPVSGPKQPVAFLNPPAQEFAAVGEAGRDPHQRWSTFPPVKFYQIQVLEATHSFHRELPAQPIWGYDGTLPGPTFVARVGEPIVIRFNNMLSNTAYGFGSPEISTHLHNGHVPSESDGYAGNYYSATKFGPTLSKAGAFYDNHYPNCCARYDASPGTNGDTREAMGTLWYHDHRDGFTAANVYRGLAGFYLIFDDVDSGNERDTNPKALRLPSGVGQYDIPLVLSDPSFDSSGMRVFDQFDPDGFLGNKFCVNGKVQPTFSVARRKYRFRLLDGSPSRFYELYLTKSNVDQSFFYVANDGNLLPAPLTLSKIRLAPAERGDIVIDFSKYPMGSQLFLENRLAQTSGKGPDSVQTSGIQLLRFTVDSEATDNSRVPAVLRAIAPINTAAATVNRSFQFDKRNGSWLINGATFDALTPAFTVKSGSTEIWTLQGSWGWHHPIHIHMEEGRILSRNGAAPPPEEMGRKDVFVLNPNDEVKVLIRFGDFLGKYMMHCHNTVHEDHAMMLRFDVVP